MAETATFPFVIHSCRAMYPERGSQATLGGGWTHTQKPVGPPSRTFLLTFEGMRYYLDDLGRIDRETNPKINLALLDDFYKEHEQHKYFLYDHYVYGTVLVLFKKPYQSPELVPQGDGASRAFTLELVEVPV